MSKTTIDDFLKEIEGKLSMETVVSYELLTGLDATYLRKLLEIVRVQSEALNSIASWREGEIVSGSFDEPGSASEARQAQARVLEIVGKG